MNCTGFLFILTFMGNFCDLWKPHKVSEFLTSVIFTYLGDFSKKNWFLIGAQVIQKWLKEKYFQDYFHQKKYRDSNKSWKPDGETWDVFIIFMVREGYFRSMF